MREPARANRAGSRMFGSDYGALGSEADVARNRLVRYELGERAVGKLGQPVASGPVVLSVTGRPPPTPSVVAYG